MAHTIKVAARSKNEVQLKLYLDRRVYDVLYEYAQPLCILPLDLVRALIAERFPEAPSEELRVGPDIEGQRAGKRLTDNRPDVCRTLGCGHSWGAHNEDAQGNELPDGGPCIRCRVNAAGNDLSNLAMLCQRFL